jgi:hypothetical protein
LEQSPQGEVPFGFGFQGEQMVPGFAKAEKAH